MLSGRIFMIMMNIIMLSVVVPIIDTSALHIIQLMNIQKENFY